jgi:hypothetical protein
MNVNLPAEISERVTGELAAGHYRNLDQFVETIVQDFLDQGLRGQQRCCALKAWALDEASLYRSIYIAPQDREGREVGLATPICRLAI